MTFEKLHQQYVIEKEEIKNFSSSWSIEITPNTEKTPLYNLLGEMIIKLSQIRARIN